jgi:glucosylceramidase
VHDAYPDMGLLFTEGCHYPFDSTKTDEWNWGELYAVSVINDLNNWSVGWTDWNLILDETGGPNHVKNFCYAPIIADTKKGVIRPMNSYYYLGHFSKFIRPGAKRIACSSVSDDLTATAFKNPDGKIAVVVLNRTDRAADFKLWYCSYVAKHFIPAHAIITLIVE